MSLPELPTRVRYLVETCYWCDKRQRWIEYSYMASRSYTAQELEAAQREECGKSDDAASLA